MTPVLKVGVTAIDLSLASDNIVEEHIFLPKRTKIKYFDQNFQKLSSRGESGPSAPPPPQLQIMTPFNFFDASQPYQLRHL